MNCWGKSFIYFFVLDSLFVVCRSCKTTKIEFERLGCDINNDMCDEPQPAMSLLKCEMESKKYERSYGCRMHVSNKTYLALRQEDWCSTRMMHPDFVYMEKRSMLFMSPIVEQFKVDEWRFKNQVSVCLKHGGVIGYSFSLKTGWTIMTINLVNKDQDKPMIMTIESTNVVRFRGNVNGSKVNAELHEGIPVQVDVTYLLEIQVLESSFKVFANGAPRYEYVTAVDKEIIQARIAFKDLPSNLHYVKYQRP